MMSINPFGSSNEATNSLIKTNISARFDPSKFVDKIAARLLSRQDADGDGDLDSSELPGLSKDAFKKLDSDGDGKVTKAEVKTALQKQLDAIKSAFESGGRAGAKDYLDSIKGTADGELLQALAPRLHGRLGAKTPTTTSTTPQTTTTSTNTTTSSTNKSSLDLLA